MAKREKIVDDVHQVTIAPNETKCIILLFIYSNLYIIIRINMFIF